MNIAVHNNLKALVDYYHENKLSHTYLLETNDIEKCYAELKIIIKNINCPHEYQDNCANCNLCKLLDNNYLPSFLVIEPDGKIIKKEQILDLKTRFSTIPIYTKENIYIIKNAECLNATSANMMLKFIEEPENNILGFFITNNVNNVISTIKSRCEIVKVFYEATTDSIYNNPYFSLVYSYLQKIELEKSKAILYNKSIFLNNANLDYNLIFKLMLDIYIQAIKVKMGEEDQEYSEQFAFLLKNDLKELRRREQIISAYLEELIYNVNIELFLDKFVIELSDFNE